MELGCGQGSDTRILCHCNIDVVGIDISEDAIEQAKKEVPQATFFCRDIRTPFPDEIESYNVILASLSLHYFDWKTTVSLISRIYEKLAVGGLLLFRVNSTNDINYGAKDNPEIEPHFYWVKDQKKRFFDQSDIERLFQRGWKIHSREERTINRYEKTKVVWEVILEKNNNRALI